MGVIYQARDDLLELLIPFVRSRGATLNDQTIVDHYTECSLGGFSSSELWRRLGIGPNPTVDEEYLAGHALNDGLGTFLSELRARGLAVHCLSNDVSEWSKRLRVRFGLESSIEHWIISGDVGVRKPDPRIYGRLLETTGLLPENCIFIDDRIPNLDAAREMGFQTLLFGPGNEQTHGHIRVPSFSEAANQVFRPTAG